MSKKAEVELNPPADADGDGSQESGSPPKPDPKGEATKKALTAMYDSMVPLSGKKVGRTLMMIVMTTDQEGEAVPRTNKGRSLLTRAQRRQALSSRKMIVSS